MGCFLSCFRGGSGGPSGDLRDPLVRENRLGDAFLSDEKKYDEATGKVDIEAPNVHRVDEELRREASYLKSCGAISQTPPEIVDSINLQVVKDAVLVEESSHELLNSDEQNVSRNEHDTDEGTLRVGSETRPSLEDKPLCQNVGDQSTDPTDSDSPYPTPLVLRGDIGTPGTIYTAHNEILKPGKRTRASRQFIYPVLRPIENKMQWMEVKAESPVLASNPPKRRNLSADCSEKAQQTFASSVVTETESLEYESNYAAAQNEVMSPDESKCQNVNPQQYEGEDLSKQSSEYGKHGVTSLSHWLKPSSATDETNSSPDDDNGNVGKETWYETSVSDVPIFPAFGLNWETDNPTPVLPKAWDGNGIPNTTTKYKEDQKVSWHATPFEERLLKVLSDEKPSREREISGKLIHLEENAE